MTDTEHKGPESVSVIGLGKLGLSTAACIASAGIDVIGVDIDESVVASVNRGQSPFDEPGLQDLITRHGNHLRAQTDFKSAVQETDLTLILVPTPSEPSGAFSTEFVVDAGRAVGHGIASKDGFHVVSLVSTVLPGKTMADLVPAIEAASGKRCGVGFGICYSPEFVALGSVVRDYLNPDFVLIGEGDERSGDLVESMYRQVCHNNPAVKRVNVVEAEITKIAVNTFVTTKITFANMLGQICDGIPGADVDAVTGALGMDSRIGSRYLKAGTGYGGPCFPRDNRALEHLADTVGASSHIPRATDAGNRDIERYFVDELMRLCPNAGKIAILGLSYKPGTWVIEESQPVSIAAELSRRGYRVSVYDPLAIDAGRELLGDTVTYADSVADCVGEADVVLIATPDNEFEGLSSDELASTKPVAVFDAWRIADAALIKAANVTHVRFGRRVEDSAESAFVQLQNSTTA